MTNLNASGDHAVALTDPKDLYSIFAVKEAGGDETPRFEAKIAKAGRRVAVVSNDGQGGCCSWHWFDRTEEKDFSIWVAEHFPDDFEPEDGWVYARLAEVAETKALMRASLKHTVFRLDGDEPGFYRTLSGSADHPALAAWFAERYPGRRVALFDRSLKKFMALAAIIEPKALTQGGH